MKIWFQILTAEGPGKAFVDACQAHVNRAADPGTIVEVHGTTYGALGDNYKFFEHFDAREVVDNIVKIRKGGSEIPGGGSKIPGGGSKIPGGGYDALIIGNSLDPCLTEAREILDIPVLALTETAVTFSELMGERFALIVPNRKFTSSYRSLIVKYQQTARLAGIFPLAFDHIPDLKKMWVDSNVMDSGVEQFRQAARLAIAQGAEVLIPCGSPTTVLNVRGVHEVDGVAILDGYSLLVKLAEAAVKLRALGQPIVSRALLYAKPPDRLIEQCGAAYQIPF